MSNGIRANNLVDSQICNNIQTQGVAPNFQEINQGGSFVTRPRGIHKWELKVKSTCQNQERGKLMQVETKTVHGCIMSEQNSKNTPNVELGKRPLPPLL